jgi:ferrous iron transport protein A
LRQNKKGNLMSENKTSQDSMSRQGRAAAMPLPMLTTGKPACVCCVAGAGHGCLQKLGSMGIVPGCKLTVLNSQNGPLLLKVGGSRYAIGRGMAQKILVHPCE